MPHVVLLGDSILDNTAYVRGEPDVITHLRRALPEGWRATLLARDGATAADVLPQLQRLPADATHLVLCVGGNDALEQAGLLEEPARSVAEALERLADAAADFEASYRQVMEAALARRLPLVLCSIYDPRFPDEGLQRVAETALLAFNDVILRAAFRHALPLLHLRLVCTEAADYANAIEPSGQGGGKIALGLVNVLQTADFSRRHAEVFVGEAGARLSPPR